MATWSADSATTLFNIFPYIQGNQFANFTDYTGTPASQPSKNQCVEDPFYFSSICKAVDYTELSALNPAVTIVRPSYMRWSIDNADHSRYMVNANGEIPRSTGKGQMSIFNSADHSLYARPAINSHENSDPRFDISNPDLMTYHSGCRFYALDPKTGTPPGTLIHDFALDVPGCSSILNGGEGDTSFQNRYWAFIVRGAYHFGSFQLLAVVVYDRQTDTVVGKLDRSKFIAMGGSSRLWDAYGYAPNIVDIAPSGDRVLALWPAIGYPFWDNHRLTPKVNRSPDPSLAYPVHVNGTTATVDISASTENWLQVGDRMILAGCTGEGIALNNANWPISGVPDTHAFQLDVTGSGVPDGHYSCTNYRQAIDRVVIAGNVATVTAGYRHRAKVGVGVLMRNVGDISPTATYTVSAVVDDYTYRFPITHADADWSGPGMYYRDARQSRYLPDDDFDFPELKPNNLVHHDGPHVYDLDFSNPVKVCNAPTHDGWGWSMDGTPMFVCQINNANWKAAQPDTISMVNIYTGEVQPILFHIDFKWQGGWHFSRFYDSSIRGWVIASQTTFPNDTNPLRDSLWAMELKPARENPRIWRIAKNHTFCYNYESEAHGSLTRDAQRWYIGANWNTNGPISTYWTDLPAGWWRVLNYERSVAPAVSSATITYYASSYTSPFTVTWSTHPDLSSPLGSQADSGGSGTRTFTIPSLSPSTDYYYRIDYGAIATSAMVSPISRFTTQGGSVATPVIQPGGGTFTSSVQVTLLCATPDAEIRYTTDGSAPTSDSTRYLSPLTLTATTSLRVKGFKGGMNESAEAAATFTITEPPISVPLPRPALMNWPDTVPLSAVLKIEYPDGYAVDHFVWTFTPASAGAPPTPALPHKGEGTISAPSFVSFTTQAMEVSLASQGLTPGTYEVSVAAVDSSDRPGLAATHRLSIVADGFGEFRVFPNPWRADRHQAQPYVTFDQLSDGVTLKIFSLDGRLLRELGPANAELRWDLKDDGGDLVASGIYLYLLTDADGNKAKGKVVIIR